MDNTPNNMADTTGELIDEIPFEENQENSLSGIEELSDMSIIEEGEPSTFEAVPLSNILDEDFPYKELRKEFTEYHRTLKKKVTSFIKILDSANEIPIDLAALHNPSLEQAIKDMEEFNKKVEEECKNIDIILNVEMGETQQENNVMEIDLASP